jgi:hypothetical protein
MDIGADGGNRARLQGFVDVALDRSKDLSRSTARALLRANAEVLRRHLAALGAWAEVDQPGPCPPHLLGLSAFDLADAADALEAEAARR